MDEDLANSIILSVKKKIGTVSCRDQLLKEIDKIREARVEFFAKLYCTKNFGHADLERIPDRYVPFFIDYIEPYVAVGLAAQRIQV